jgi:hypothetical protein
VTLHKSEVTHNGSTNGSQNIHGISTFFHSFILHEHETTPRR